MISTSYLLVPLLLASYASAHGFVAQFTVNGQTHTSARPSSQRSSQPASIRQIGLPDPVYGAKNPDMNCGYGPVFAASDTAKVNAGDTLAIDWKGADMSNWPHKAGPVVTYLAECGDGGCPNFDSTKARWFKIDQQGFKPGGEMDGPNFAWWLIDSFNGKTLNVRIPPSLAPGDYLMRHEIIALHIASGFQKAEFYPSCAQLSISGSGTSKPSSDELVSFPGAYDDRDKGIMIDIFSGLKPEDYVFPGPPIARLAQDSAVGGNGGNSSSGGANGGSNQNNNGGGSSDSGAGKSSKAKTCRLKKGAKRAAGATLAAEVRPRHISRIMRRLAASLGGSAH